MNALGMIEVQSIPLGVNAGDAMLKAATVQLVTAQPVCAGKYIVIVTGEVSAVSESVCWYRAGEYPGMFLYCTVTTALEVAVGPSLAASWLPLSST